MTGDLVLSSADVARIVRMLRELLEVTQSRSTYADVHQLLQCIGDRAPPPENDLTR